MTWDRKTDCVRAKMEGIMKITLVRWATRTRRIFKGMSMRLNKKGLGFGHITKKEL